MTLVFLVSALIAFAGSLLMVLHKHAVYALLGLLIAFLASSGIFLSLDAPFIAVAQILIYAGALAVLFLFVLMFTDTSTPGDAAGLPNAIGSRAVFDSKTAAPKKKKRKRGQLPDFPNPLASLIAPKPMALVISLALLVCMTFAIYHLPASFGSFASLPESYDTGLTSSVPGQPGERAPRLVEYGTTEAVSFTILEGFPLAFEVVSLLIFAALLGAVLLARRHLAGAPSHRDARREQEQPDV
jgi:NADH:ubiquinone oxidoreductase subunit 6 (subunit J)